ncbi:Mur ligase family protein [Thiocystis violacea]|uniref:Mur ligase family protein n=1 Tax=Thiocystis violacea TaxID=13725 RepID=UPI0019076D0E|nr:cyanophycin synthetase [Thiocystis violacea]MBK1721726.1 UDP-N-acetylmuramoylalanyl-D-glutamate--2,6-diaminopimelate ligase [Thiocystis violacea]
MMALAHANHAWRLGDLLAGLVDLGAASLAVLEQHVCDLTLDSREVVPGALFLACQGTLIHGLACADEAKRRGAVAVLAEISDAWPAAQVSEVSARLGLPVIPVVHLRAHLGAIADRFHGSPSARLEVLAVSGSQGKTTVSHLLAQALDQERPCAIIGPAASGRLGQLQSTEQDMANALSLQANLSRLLGQGARAVTLALSPADFWASSRSALRLSHVVCTQVAPGTAVSAFGGVLADWPGLDWAVLNLDDPVQRAILERVPASVCVAGYSLDPKTPMPGRCDLFVRTRSVQSMASGLRLQVECLNGSEQDSALLEVGLIGRFNAANVLAVLAVMCSRGLPLERAVRALARVRGVPGRMECFGGEGAPLVVVDSARSSEAVEKALRNLRLHQCRRLITVVGCEQGRDAGERARLGEVVERLSDAVILTDDNPRDTSGDAIISGILAGMQAPDRVRVERQRGLAIRIAIALAGVGDAVLVAGKGSETIQDMGDLKVRFSDRAQVVEALREWREGHH